MENFCGNKLFVVSLNESTCPSTSPFHKFRVRCLPAYHANKKKTTRPRQYVVLGDFRVGACPESPYFTCLLSCALESPEIAVRSGNLLKRMFVTVAGRTLVRTTRTAFQDFSVVFVKECWSRPCRTPQPIRMSLIHICIDLARGKISPRWSC